MKNRHSLQGFPDEIHSKRLLLRPLSIDVKEMIFQEFTPEITTYMVPDPPKEIGETENFITSTVKKMSNGEEMVFVILKSENEEFLGLTGIHALNTKTPEFGIWLKKEAHGNGFGREAITALKEWIDKNVKYEYLLYPVDQENIPSRKIPESLGGVVHREYKKQTPSGKVLNTVEYRIYPPR